MRRSSRRVNRGLRAGARSVYIHDHAIGIGDAGGLIFGAAAELDNDSRVVVGIPDAHAADFRILLRRGLARGGCACGSSARRGSARGSSQRRRSRPRCRASLLWRRLGLSGGLYLVALYLGHRLARLRRKGRVRILLEKILIVLLRQVRLGEIVFADLRDGHERLFAVFRFGIVANQKLVGLDGRIEVLGLELLAHSAVEIGGDLDGRRNLRRPRRNQVDAAVGRNQVFVIAQRAFAFGFGFQRGAQRFRAFKLPLRRGAAGKIAFLRGGRRNSAQSQRND